MNIFSSAEEAALFFYFTVKLVNTIIITQHNIYSIIPMHCLFVTQVTNTASSDVFCSSFLAH